MGSRSAVEAIQGAEVVFTMVQTGEQVHNICLGEDGIFNSLPVGTLYIDCSSIDIASVKHLHEEASKRNIVMLDAPVSGGVKGAQKATLTIMVGGEIAGFQRAKTFLQAIGKLVVHAGGSGSGQIAKICNNLVLGISMIAISEAFSLGEKLGLESKKFFEICSHASGQCWALTNYCPVPGLVENTPSNNHYQAGFAAAMMLKDLKLSQDAAELADINTELGAKATELYQRFVDSDHGSMDFSGIINMIREKEIFEKI